MAAPGRIDGGLLDRLARAAEALRVATVEAHQRGSWLAPTLDDCRVDAERLLVLGTGGPPVEALLARAELIVRTWARLAPLAGGGSVGTPCLQCGTGTLRPLARAGRTAPFRGEQLPIPDDFVIPTCDGCGGESLDPATAAQLDQHLWNAWTARNG